MIDTSCTLAPPLSSPAMRYALLPLLLSSVLACSGETGSGGDTGGTLVISVGADADYLLPPITQALVGRQVFDQVFYRLAELESPLRTIGDEGFESRIASEWEWADDSLSIAFSIDPRARWHDGTPIRARDVVFSWALYVDTLVASPTAVYLENVDSVTAPDSMTAVIWFERRKPEQFFEVVHNLMVLPSHLLGETDRAQIRSSPLATAPVGSGPYRVARWERGSRIELVADTAHWRGRPRLDRVIWTIAPNPATAATRLFAGEADLYESMRPELIEQARNDSMIALQPYRSLQYGFMQFNLRDARNPAQPHPIFSDRNVRRALAMAIDRERLVRNIYDTLAYVAIGPVPRAVAADTSMTHLPFDPARAQQLLDSLGWRDANGDGIRERNGRPLAFGVIVPSSSRPRLDAAVVMQEMLRQVGANLEVEQMEFNAFLERQRTRRFDAWMGLWQTDPSPSGVLQTWGASGESNFGAYANARFDALVDSAVHAPAADASRRFWRTAYQTIIDDAPAIWLYEPRLVMGHHRRLQLAGLREDAWWAGIPEWSIPADERIARDRIPVAMRPE